MDSGVGALSRDFQPNGLAEAAFRSNPNLFIHSVRLSQSNDRFVPRFPSMNCQFSFGPDGSYFCSAGSAFKWGEHSIPVEFARLLQNRNDPLSLHTPYDIAFPPSEHGTFAGCWKSLSGEDRFYVPGNYMCLARLIKSLGANFAPGQTTRTVFGHGGSFFSMSPKGYAWQNLPEALEDDIIHSMRVRRPVCVALGYQNAYVVLYTDGNVLFDLRGYYPSVEAMIRNTQEATRRGGLTYVSLNPHVSDEFYAAFGDGSAIWNIPRAWTENVMFVSRHIAPIVKSPVATSPGGTASSQSPTAGVSVAQGGTAPSLATDDGAKSVGHAVQPAASDAPPATSPGGTTPVVDTVPGAAGGTAPRPMVNGHTESAGGVSTGSSAPIVSDTPPTSISPESVPVAPGGVAPPATADSGLDSGDSGGHAVPIASPVAAASSNGTQSAAVQSYTVTPGGSASSSIPVAAVSSGGTQSAAVQHHTVAPGGSAPSSRSIGGTASNGGVYVGQTAALASPTSSQLPTGYFSPNAGGVTAPSPPVFATPASPPSSTVRPTSSSGKPKMGWRQGVSMGIKAARGLNKVVSAVQNPSSAVNNAVTAVQNPNVALNSVVNAVQNPSASLNDVVNAVQNSKLANETAGQMFNNAENALIQHMTSQPTPPASPGPSQFLTAMGNPVSPAGPQSPSSSTSRFRATSSPAKPQKMGWKQGVTMGIKAARGLNKAVNIVEGNPTQPTTPGEQMLEKMEDAFIQQVEGQQTPPANQGGQMLENMENVLIQQVMAQQTPPADAANAQVNS
ncbi:hypothetical protein B0H11DRAFT_2019718 [Mycena galericulata]|nr:hypothetical protein B0H11DRAFT_2019718 [Mycena galericulata]